MSSPAHCAPRGGRAVRRRARVLGAAALALTLGLGACGSAERRGAPADPAAGPVTLVHGEDALSTAASAVVARHLVDRGHTVVEADPVGAAQGRPWRAAGGSTVAVVDTLAVALVTDPEAALPDVPRPTPTPSAPKGSASSATLPPLDPAAPSRVPTDPSATEAPRSTLPTGSPAADADAARAAVESALAGRPTGPSGTASADPLSRAAQATSSAASASVLAASRSPLRLAAVVTATTAQRLELDSVDDLNQRCETLTAAAPAELDAAEHPEAASRLAARLDRLAGCRPEAWVTPEAGPAAAVVGDDAQVGLAYRTDPEVSASELVALEDGGRVLPEGRLAVLGDREDLDDDAQGAIREVMDAMDEEGLRELARLTSGPDALEPGEAAQYWLVSRGLEDAPEGWFMPRGTWF